MVTFWFESVKKRADSIRLFLVWLGVLPMQAGAADYLIKARIDAATLERSIRYSLEQ